MPRDVFFVRQNISYACFGVCMNNVNIGHAAPEYVASCRFGMLSISMENAFLVSAIVGLFVLECHTLTRRNRWPKYSHKYLGKVARFFVYRKVITIIIIIIEQLRSVG